MKKSIIILALLGTTILCKAQTASVQTKPDTVLLKIPADKLNLLKQVLQYSADNLPTSEGKAKDVGDVIKAMQQLWPLLNPADQPKPVTPVKKK